MIQFTVMGTPIPKARARVTTIGGFARAYTPKSTVDYEKRVAAAARAAMGAKQPDTGPIEIMLELRMPVPVSWSKKKRAAALSGLVRATKKPDSGNIQKAIEDAMNDIAYIDDAQIVITTVRKLYAAEPCVVVAVRVVEGEAA